MTRVLFVAGWLSLSSLLSLGAADDYVLGPDSKAQPGVPKGEVTKHTFDHSKVFPGTTRDYWVYVPRQYDPTKPACLMVFQDGLQYSAPTVFDNLIEKKEIPVIIGVFVAPGKLPAIATNALDRFNRSYEYDGLGDEYARFLLTELLPEATQKYNLSTKANDHAIAGSSSGGIAAFTAAWERPDAFRRVFTSVGTYVGLRGGNEYPTLVRKTEPKPLRIFLQDGANDQNIYGGNWYLANLELLSALEFAGYEVNHAWGDGGHNGKHAGAVFPEALRWLWQDYPNPVVAGKGSRLPLMRLLIPGEDWQVASAGHQQLGGLAGNGAGGDFFADAATRGIHKIALDGQVSVFAKDCPGVSGLGFGPAGKLYACLEGRRRIVAYDSQGRQKVVIKNVDAHSLVVSHLGNIYFTDPARRKVWFVNAQGEKRVVDEGIADPTSVQLTPDQTLLLVADAQGQFIYSFQIQPDGSLTARQRYHYLHLVNGSPRSGTEGMVVDNQGWLYATSEMGVQLCDQLGRVNLILPTPQRMALSGIAFGGTNHDQLFLACGDKVLVRKTKAKGVSSAETPIKPGPTGL